MTLRILGDRVLIKLAPPVTETPSGLILSEAVPPPTTYGKVVQAGPHVTDVKPGQVVAFDPGAGDPLDGFFPTPHIVISERQVVLVYERTTSH